MDGGSADGSKEYIESIQDKLTYWVSEPDKGIYNAMNKAIKAATGEYLLFLNSGDNLLNKEIINSVIPYLGKEDIVYGDGIFNTDEGDRIKTSIPENLNLSYFSQSSLFPSVFIY